MLNRQFFSQYITNNKIVLVVLSIVVFYMLAILAGMYFSYK